MPTIIALLVGLGSLGGYTANDKEIPQHMAHAVYEWAAEPQEWRDMQKRLQWDERYLNSVASDRPVFVMEGVSHAQ